MSRSPWRDRVVGTFNLVAGLGLTLVFCVLLFGVALLTLFQARRFYAEFCIAHFSRLMLWLSRTPFRVARPPSGDPGPVFYMPNHPSTQDIFVLTALALPNTRFFLSRGVLFRFPPVGLVAALMGVFFTPDQKDTPARVRCFQRAFTHLQKSGESVLGTPEGRVTPEPEVGPFNRGVFHLVTLLQIPIQPIYLAFPPGTSAGRGYAPKNASVEVFFLPRIDTRGWRVDNIDLHKNEVREVFLSFGRSLAAGAET